MGKHGQIDNIYHTEIMKMVGKINIYVVKTLHFIVFSSIELRKKINISNTDCQISDIFFPPICCADNS